MKIELDTIEQTQQDLNEFEKLKQEDRKKLLEALQGINQILIDLDESLRKLAKEYVQGF